MILFNKPPYVGKEVDYIKEAIENQKICGTDHLQRNVTSGWKKDLGTKKDASYHKWIHCVRYGSLFYVIWSQEMK